MTPLDEPQRSRTAESGFAFLLALALLTVLAGAVALIQSIGFASVGDAAVEIRQGSARLMLDGAMRTRIERVFLSDIVDPGVVAGITDAPAGTLSFHLDFEDGRVDVNSAPPELVRLALQAAGADDGTAGSVLASIAELRKRRAAVVDPLQLFPTESRITDRTAKEQSRFLTASSGSRGINPSAAEREFLDRIAPEGVAAIGRAGAGAANGTLGPSQAWLTSTRTTISLTGAYRHRDGWTLRRKAIFRIDRGRHAVQFLAWRTI